MSLMCSAPARPSPASRSASVVNPEMSKKASVPSTSTHPPAGASIEPPRRQLRDIGVERLSTPFGHEPSRLIPTAAPTSVAPITKPSMDHWRLRCFFHAMLLAAVICRVSIGRMSSS